MDAWDSESRQHTHAGTDGSALGDRWDGSDALAALQAIERVIGLCGACFDRTMAPERALPDGRARSEFDRRLPAWDDRPVRPRRMAPAH